MTTRTSRRPSNKVCPNCSRKSIYPEKGGTKEDVKNEWNYATDYIPIRLVRTGTKDGKEYLIKLSTFLGDK